MKRQRLQRTLSVSVSVITILTVMMSAAALAQQVPPVESTKAHRRPRAKPKRRRPHPRPKPEEPAKEKERPKASTDEEPVVTHHTVAVDGRDLKYTATAGLMPIRDAKGDVEGADLLHRLHSRRCQAPAARAVALQLQRRPGFGIGLAASGGTRPEAGHAARRGRRSPHRRSGLVDNDATWLDRADLVFIDPVGTGFSRAAKPELNSKFHSLQRRHRHPSASSSGCT